MKSPSVIVLFLCAVAAASETVAAEPARLEIYDPLAHPAPALERALVVPDDNQRPEDKIVPRLWQRMQAEGARGEIAVIIELQQPKHRGGSIEYSREWDGEQAELSAAIEHRFAARAANLVSGLRGRSDFPIVFGQASPGAIQTISALPEVFRIYEDEVVLLSRTQGAALIKADVLRTGSGGTGSGITVAVLDTGIDGSHPEFAGRIPAHTDATFTTGDGRIDDHGHGTAAAGIIAGANGGMAPQANLWAIKVLKGNGQSTASSIGIGLDAAYAQRNNFGGLDVINMSIQGTDPFATDCDLAVPYNTVFNNLVAAGISIIVSSGNSGFGNGVSIPACHSKVVAVGAVYDSNVGPRGPFTVSGGTCTDATTSADQITCYSNSGIPLDILAPADCAVTPAPGGGYNQCFDGTSAAAPYAAGVAAQLLQLHPGTSPATLRTVLMATGKPLTDVNAITRGRIDAVAAHQALSPTTGPCVQDAITACVLNNRFRVTLKFLNIFVNPPVLLDGLRVPVIGFASPSRETVFFHLNDPNNIEVLIKMLDQGNTNPQGQPTIAVLYGLATPLGTEVTITDTTNGVQKKYTSGGGEQRGQTDFTAFVK